MYPIDRYKFFQNNNKIIAVSSYAGRTVKGIAKCDSRDTFDLQKGKELAAARCAKKIALKRLNRAIRKCDEASAMFHRAGEHLDRMGAYQDDAYAEFYQAQEHLADLEASM